MILEMFFGFLAVAFLLIVIGEYIRIGSFSVVGYIFISLLSLSVILPSFLHTPLYTDCLQYRSGNTITSVNSTTTVTTDNYTCMSDTTTTFYFGYLLFFLGFFSMLFLHWIRKKEKKRVVERYEEG